MIVAIDGPSGVGKGTLARLLANHYGWDYMDTGALYRALAHLALTRGVALDNGNDLARLATDIGPGAFDDPALRDEEVGRAASRVAALPAVREALLALQRRFAHHPPGGKGAVLDGRDIGTVVCPDADVKLFLTADLATRTARRCRQLEEQGLAVDKRQIERDLVERDGRDANRAVAPLAPAEDAHLLDTTNLDIDSTFQVANAIIKDRLAL